MDRCVASTYEVDFTGLKLPIITVYKSPRDYPGCYVARVFDMDKPTNVTITRDNLEDLQQDIAEHTGMVFIPRSMEDGQQVIGTWI